MPDTPSAHAPDTPSGAGSATPISGDEIRAAYLRFFEERGHLVMPSASLIPAGDPTLLLTTAGMAPFKPYYAGDEQPPCPRLASAQKCFRATDIDEVGDFTHHTMFEMLGNFSIGDYFKREAVAWAWEFTTGVLRLAPERIWITVHHTDDEARAIWRDEIGVPDERIVTLGDADNFWGPAGDEGACGPCSELHYDLGEEHGPGTKPGDDTGRYVEIWNLVFPQFHQAPDGSRTNLPAPGIDTGMGLERVAAIMQGVPSAYETDLLAPVRERVERLAGKTYGANADDDVAIRVVAEHARAAAFLIADGVVPANEGRGYVLRRVIRRGVRFARKIGMEPGFLPETARAVIERFGATYRELREHGPFVLKTMESEEERFYEASERGEYFLNNYLETAAEIGTQSLRIRKVAEEHGSLPPGALKEALRLVRPKELTLGSGGSAFALETLVSRISFSLYGEIEGYLNDPRRKDNVPKDLVDEVEQKWTATHQLLEPMLGDGRLPDNVAFRLYDTYGFPMEMTQEIARERGLELDIEGFGRKPLEVDVEGFEREMEAQRERGRASARFGAGREAARVYEGLGAGETAFTGYDRLETQSVIVGILKDGEPVERAIAGDLVEIVLRETPFYPEGGGQVGDAGVIAADGGAARVTDARKPAGGVIAHSCEVADGALAVGDAVRASVDAERRLDTARNHTATHLLHAVLRDVLGAHVRQAGSLVAPDRLRFDFTHVSGVGRAELNEIERRVNEAVRADHALVKSEASYRDATAQGALAFFGDRYGERVRAVRIGEADAPVSFEVCGGTHLERTGQIGVFRVTGESSVGAGVRRIEAVTGRGGEEWVNGRLSRLEEAAALLRAAPADLPQRIEALLAQVEEARKASRTGRRESSRQEADALLAQAVDAGGAKVIAARIDAADAGALREMGDRLRDKIGSGVVALGSALNDRPALLAIVTDDLVERGLSAGEIVDEAAREMGGRGGGQARLAQAGGKDASRLGAALAAVPGIVARRMQGR